MSIEFPLGNPAPAQWFSGEVHMAKLDDNLQIETVNVSFEAGGRTNWHTHPVGQNIIVLSGLGIYEAEGEPARLLEPGDVVFAAAGVRHWHGAVSGAPMFHVVVNLKGIDGETVDWEEPVDEEHYRSVSAELQR